MYEDEVWARDQCKQRGLRYISHETYRTKLNHYVWIAVWDGADRYELRLNRSPRKVSMNISTLITILERARDRFTQGSHGWTVIDSILIEAYYRPQEPSCTDQSKSQPTSVFSSQTTDAPAAATNGSPATLVSQTRVSVLLEALVSHLEKSGSLSLDFGNGVKLSITRDALGVCHFNLVSDGKSQN